MSNKDTSYLQVLCSMSDDYLEYIDTLNNDELHSEHREAFGDDAQRRLKTIQDIFSNVIINKKKSIVSHLPSCNKEIHVSDDDIVDKVKNKYGSLINFFENKFLLDSTMPSGLTLQYRNMKSVTDEDIILLIQALHINGDLKIEDDKD